jgi:hypothetical protein
VQGTVPAASVSVQLIVGNCEVDSDRILEVDHAH